jgi:hypothetical protein
MSERPPPPDVERSNNDETKEGQPNEGPNLANLTGIGAAATTLIAIVSALAVTGVLQRTQRNEGENLGIAFSLVIGAAVGWVAIWILKPSGWRRAARFGRWAEVGVGALAVLALGIGLGFAIHAVIETQKLTQRPTIEARISPGAALEATVKASGLTADSRIVIYVDGLRPDPEHPGAYRPLATIYQAYLGPDSDGEVKEPVSVVIPQGQYQAVGLRAWTTSEEPPCEFTDIDPKKTGTRLGAACVILPLPRSPSRPQLTAAWDEKSGGGRTLNVKATSANSPHERLIVVRVMANGGGKTVELARLLGEPDASGTAQVETSVTVPTNMHLVCADARFIDSKKIVRSVRCPANRKGPAAAVAQLVVP